MGYIKHHAIVVVGWDGYFDAGITKATEIFGAGAIGVATEEGVNGYRSFFIAPDGSKEGWTDSNEGNERRRKFKEWLRTTTLEWTEVVLGPDDRASYVSDHRWNGMDDDD